MSFFVYVLGSKKKPKKTYIGWTNNLKKRLSKHNTGKGAKSTRGRKWQIIYHEKLPTKSIAMKKEYSLKKNIKFRSKMRSKI
jgi:putative endonuclease|tara:strand:- start:350 stop:595 length:246 start_codon:yes stop_codon:yes gene_type:complete